jgi:hypothetical protein
MCGYTEADKHFEKWRQARFGVNLSVVMGVAFVWPAFAVTPIDAVAAHAQREAMVEALQESMKEDMTPAPQVAAR